MRSQTSRINNYWRAAMLTGAIAALLWGVMILPAEYFRSGAAPRDPGNIYRLFAIMNVTLRSIAIVAVIGGIVGALATLLGGAADRPTVAQALWGAAIGAGIVLVAFMSKPWSLPLPLLLLCGALPGLLGGIAGAWRRRTPPAPAAHV